jgi:hypothetical protein
MSKSDEALDHVLSMLLKETDAVTAEYWASAANKLAGVVECMQRIDLIDLQLENNEKKETE